VQDGSGQWTEDDYQRAQSSSVSPRGGYCSSASTPHSSGGSYGTTAASAAVAATANGYAPAPNMGTLSSSPGSVFNSTSSKFLVRDIPFKWSSKCPAFGTSSGIICMF